MRTTKIRNNTTLFPKTGLALVLALAAGPAWAQETTETQPEEQPVAEEAPAEETAAEPETAAESESEVATEANAEGGEEILQKEGEGEKSAEPSEAAAQETQATGAAVGGFSSLSEDSTGTGPSLKKEEEEEKVKMGLSLDVSASHAATSGIFYRRTEDPADGSYGSVTQDWSIMANYRFPFMGHKLKAQVWFPFSTELTHPNAANPERFRTSDTLVTLSDGALYKHDASDVTINGHARLYFPTSWRSFDGDTAYYTSARVGFGASRSFGPVDTSFSTYLRYTAHQTPFRRRRVDLPVRIARLTDGEFADEALIGSAGEQAPWSSGVSGSVGWNITEAMSLSYTLLWYGYMSAGTSLQVDDEFKSPNAQVGGNLKSSNFWPTLEWAYSLDELIGKEMDLPIKLSMAVGASALHPVQSANGDPILPLIFNTFVNNGYANGGQNVRPGPNEYGSIYLELKGSY